MPHIARAPSHRPIDILLVEDNVGDQRLTIEALKEVGLKSRLHIAGDGVEALDFLQRRGVYAGSPQPDLILLDLNLPKKDGRQVLAEIKADRVLRRIPTMVLSSSQADEDVLGAYDLHVNCYITKPMDMARLVDIVRAIDHFWLSVVTLPTPPYC